MGENVVRGIEFRDTFGDPRQGWPRQDIVFDEELILQLQ